MHNPWQVTRGATLDRSTGGVRFAVWAPLASAASVRILDGPARGDYPMTCSATERGVWEATVAGAGAGADYRYVLRSNDGETKELPDPVSRWQPDGVHGPSRVVDTGVFEWTDDGWSGIPLEQYVIHEVHVGTFTPEGTFDAAIERLPSLREIGVTAVELMPVAEFPGARNWGYDGVFLYAPQSSYGGPEGLARFVDAAHRAGLAVVLDVVYNHVGPEGNYLDSFGPYFTEAYRTPWGRAVNYDGPDSDEVRRWVLDNARYWIADYHVDALRLDAVHGIFDHGATHLLREIADAVHETGETLGRHCLVIAESDLNDPRLLRAPSVGGYGLDAQWADDFHHAVHAALTGERQGYYQDFGSVEMIAQALREPFVYAGQYSPHRRRRHGASAAGIPRQRFVVAIQNHDQVGNRASGDRLSDVLAPDQLRLSAALLLLSAYVPLIFMGQEYGETNPFQYFVSHGDPELVAAVREGRRREFEAFGWGEDVPDPQAERTFDASKLDWRKPEREPHAQMLALYRDLLALRSEEPALLPATASLGVASGGDGWISVLYRPTYSAGASLVGFFNCAAAAQRIPWPAGASAAARCWRLRLCTDASGYGGDDRLPATEVPLGAAADAPRRLMERESDEAIALPQWCAAVYESV